MALTQPTYTYGNAQLRLTFTANPNYPFTVYVDQGVYDTLTDTQLNSNINSIMASLRVFYPSGPITCDVAWINNSTNNSTRVTYAG